MVLVASPSALEVAVIPLSELCDLVLECLCSSVQFKLCGFGEMYYKAKQV